MNLGTGREVSIAGLAGMVATACRFTGGLRFDASKPDGQPRRCLDTRRAAERLGFTARVGLEDGLKRTVAWFEEQRAQGGVREVVYG